MAPVCGCRCIAAGAVAACGVCVVSEIRAGCPSVGGRFGIAGCVGCALSVPPIHRASKRSVLFFMIFRYIGSFVPSVPLPYRAVSAVAAPCIRRRNRGYRTVVSVPPAVPPAVSAVGKFRYGPDAARIAPKRSCRCSDSAAAQCGSFNRTIFGCTISLPSTLRAMTGVKRFRQLVPPFYSAVPRARRAPSPMVVPASAAGSGSACPASSLCDRCVMWRCGAVCIVVQYPALTLRSRAARTRFRLCAAGRGPLPSGIRRSRPRAGYLPV